jgi:hypothetical protein
MEFIHDKYEHDAAAVFQDAHSHKGAKKGAIGGGITFTFTPTSIGILAGIKCAVCGEHALLTNAETL